VLVAVATHVEGFRTVVELLIPFAFHAGVSIAGLQMIRASKLYGATELTRQAAE